MRINLHTCIVRCLGNTEISSEYPTQTCLQQYHLRLLRAQFRLIALALREVLVEIQASGTISDSEAKQLTTGCEQFVPVFAKHLSKFRTKERHKVDWLL